MAPGTSYTRESFRTLHLALADFYAPGLEAATFVERAFALTSRLVRSDLNSHGILDVARGALTANFDTALPGLPDAFAAFGRHMAKYQPFRFDPACNGGMPFSVRDFYSKPAFEDLDIFEEVYRPMRLVDHCFVHVPAPSSDEVVFVGMLRGSRAFDAREKELLGVLQPHLANGRALAQAVSAAKERALSPELFSHLGFTPRESDVLFWLTQGKSTQEMSLLLRVRSDSVRRYLQCIYDKLGVHNRAAATLRAVEIARKALDEDDWAKGSVRLRVDIRR